MQLSPKRGEGGLRAVALVEKRREGGGRVAGGVFVYLAKGGGCGGVAGRLRFEKQTTVICLRGGLSDVFLLSQTRGGRAREGLFAFKSL